VDRDVKDRLAVLSALDTTERLRLVAGLLSSVLESLRGAAANAGGAPSPTPVDGELSGASGRDEVGRLVLRLRAASPPPEVMQAALREQRRLTSSADGQPGHAMALAYLEGRFSPFH
jgi:hypothetical protein